MVDDTFIAVYRGPWWMRRNMLHVYGYRYVYARKRLGIFISQAMNIDTTVPTLPRFKRNPWCGLPPSLFLYELQKRGNTRAFA